MLLICLVGRKSVVQVAQVVIPNTMCVESFDLVWKQKMDLLLKATNPTSDKNENKQRTTAIQRFGFQISCCGRGSSFHAGRDNYESSLFLKSFPDVSLTGFFANGEIGSDYFTSQQQHIQKLKGEDATMTTTTTTINRHHTRSSHLQHNELEFLTYSSVFTIVSIR